MGVTTTTQQYSNLLRQQMEKLNGSQPPGVAGKAEDGKAGNGRGRAFQTLHFCHI